MRTFKDLSTQEKAKACEICFAQLVEDIIQGRARLRADYQAIVDECWVEAESKQTPWFIEEIITQHERLKPVLQILSSREAMKAIYPHKDQRVIRL